MASITCGNCKATHTTVEAVKLCYNIAPKGIDPIVVATIDRAVAIADQNLVDQAYAREQADIRARQEAWEQHLHERRAPQISPSAPVTPIRPRYAMIPPGVYKVGSTVYKVKPARASNRTFAHELVGDEFVYRGISGKYVPEGSPFISKEEAAEFGHSHGWCMMCGRLLTDEVSVANGIGPVCAGNMGW